MNSDSPSTANLNSDAKAKKNRTLLLMLFVSVLPIAAAYFVYFTGLGVPENRVNAGLLLPTPMPLKALIGESKAETFLDDKKFRLFIPIDEQCGEDCQQNLYVSRQVHIRLGTKSSRVERIAVNIGGEQGQEFYTSIVKEHPKLKLITVSKDAWQDWIAQASSSLSKNADHFYLLLDQEKGNTMMAYNNEQSGNELFEDLKHVLKHSVDYK